MGTVRHSGWFALPNAVVESGLSPYETVVLVYLYRRAGKDGSSWPSYDTIATDLSMSRRQAIRCIQSLSSKGCLKKHPKQTVAGDPASNTYEVELALPTTGSGGGDTESPGWRPTVTRGGDSPAPKVLPSTKYYPDEVQVQYVGGEGFIVSPLTRARWQAAYPAISIDTEIRAAFEWTVANPKNLKSNWTRFLVAWLKRAQDRVPAAAHGPVPSPSSSSGPAKIRPAILDEPPPDFRPMPDAVRKQLAGLVNGMKMP